MTATEAFSVIAALLAGAASVATVASFWRQAGRPARFRRLLETTATALPLADHDEVGLLKKLRRRATAELVGYSEVPVSRDLPWTTGLPIAATLAAVVMGFFHRVSPSNPSYLPVVVAASLLLYSVVGGVVMEHVGFTHRWVRDAIVNTYLRESESFELPRVDPRKHRSLGALWALTCSVLMLALLQSGAFMVGYFYDGWVWGQSGTETPSMGVALACLGLTPMMLRWSLAARRQK